MHLFLIYAPVMSIQTAFFQARLPLKVFEIHKNKIYDVFFVKV